MGGSRSWPTVHSGKARPTIFAAIGVSHRGFALPSMPKEGRPLVSSANWLVWAMRAFAR